MPAPTRRRRAYQRLVISIAALTIAGCATNPAARRATLIADADRDARAAVADESRLSAASIPSRSVAVLPFTVDDRDTLLTPLGFGLAEILSTDLARSPQLQLVDRLRIDALLRELQLVDAGITDPATAPRAGRLMAARRLVIGSITRSPDNTLALHARAVDVVDGTVQELVSAQAPLDRILDAERSLAILLFDRLGVTLTPAQRLAIEQQQTTQLSTLVAFGRGAQAEAHGDATGAAAAYAEASRLDAAFVAGHASRSSTNASSSTSSAVQRVVALSTQALNQPAAARVSEAADAPLPASLSIGIVISIHILP